MKAIIVRESVEIGFEIIETDTDNLIEVAQQNGFNLCGYTDNERPREQLRNRPRFSSLLGPMWDGDKIRYETPTVYEPLSN